MVEELRAKVSGRWYKLELNLKDDVGDPCDSCCLHKIKGSCEVSTSCEELLGANGYLTELDLVEAAIITVQEAEDAKRNINMG